MDDFSELRSEGFDRQKLFRLPRRAELRMLDLAFTRDLVVSDLGYYPKARGHFVDREHGISSDILIFCMSGRGWYSVGGKRRDVRAMDMFWIPAGGAHQYASHRDDPWQIYWVHAYGAMVSGLLAWTPLTQSRTLTTFTNANALRRQFNAVIQRIEAGYTDLTLLEISRFFVSLVTLLHVDGGSARELGQREQIEKAMELMRQTRSAPLSLNAYAQCAGFSVSQFSHHFKRHYGSSPMAYFTEIRIQQAKELIDGTDLSVKEVAWKMGFDDSLYFSRIFKKVTGVSPTHYRDEHV